MIDGTAVWAIWYELRVPVLDDDPVAYRTEWIAKDSLRLVRQVQQYRDPKRATDEWTSDLFYPD